MSKIFDRIGINSKETARLSGIRSLEESSGSVGSPCTCKDGKGGKKRMTKSTLESYRKLDFDAMNEAEVIRVLADLLEHEVDEADTDLTEDTIELLADLKEAAFKRMVTSLGRVVKRRVLRGKEKLAGRVYRRRNRAKLKRSSRKWRIGSLGKKYKRLSSRSQIKAKRDRNANESDSDYLKRLSALTESVADDGTPEAEQLLERMDAIFDMLAEEYADFPNVLKAIDEETGSAFQTLEEGVNDVESFEATILPSVRLISVLMERIESGALDRELGGETRGN